VLIEINRIICDVNVEMYVSSTIIEGRGCGLGDSSEIA